MLASEMRTPLSFGRYKVKALLGEGAMGRVYLADDPVLDRQVAIKVIAIDKQPDKRTREEYLQRFNLEAKACAKLNHPSIVTIFDAGEENGIPWIAFEYVEGDSLDKLIKENGGLDFDKILSVMLDITSALFHAHELGIVHRDIKPANILIDKRTKIAKLTDFGVVKAPNIALTQDGTAVGSPGYMAPEQLDGSGVDARSDLFSLGIVLYEMLTGKHPFLKTSIPATIYATLHCNYQPIEELRPDVPSYLVDITEKLLVSEPSKRIQSAAALLNMLRSGNRKLKEEKIEQLSEQSILTGNTTRLKRISHSLQYIRNKHFFNKGLLNEGLLGIKKILKNRQKIFRNLYNILQKRMWTKGKFTISYYSAILYSSLLIFLVLLILQIANLTSSEERLAIKELRKAGFKKPSRSLIDTCIKLVNINNNSKAEEISTKLIKIKRTKKEAFLLVGIIALGEYKDSLATEMFLKFSSYKKKLKVHSELLPLFIRNCKSRFSYDKVDSSLLGSIANAIYSESVKDSVNLWIRSTPYWLRWNSVRLAGFLRMPVDSVEVYILDLKYAGSVRTRTKAATRLGELGDRRAVEPLKKAAAAGILDPAVSFTAEMVLKNYFPDTISSNKIESKK
ncbi:MAG: protein kinase [Chitinispirillaceae bacterium]|nr:protein kinase [Chitinispirillaceae bacterium]